MRPFIGSVCFVILWGSSLALIGQADDLGKPVTITINSPQEFAQKNFHVIYNRDASGKESIIAELKPGADELAPRDVKLHVLGSNVTMFGKSTEEGNKCMFYPAFPLQPGLEYLIGVFPPPHSPIYLYLFTLPKPDRSPKTTVTAVYPSADQLPENLLKFYIHFSNSMSVGNVYDYIQLLDESGRPLELPFLELGEELWDYDTRRLTLLFDPGRIKSGLVPNLEEGMVLEAGKTYTLRIAPDWKDAEGRSLVHGFEKTFRVIAADTVSPNPYNWEKEWPTAQTHEPVSLRFPEPLDEALLQRIIQVKREDGSVVQGAIQVSEHETRWQFTPDQAWTSGKYHLEIETILEDMAGNSIARPFEVEQRRAESYRHGPKVVNLKFEIQ